ncbi:MAG: CarD family transcriptional regulator [Kofleriaceae bacterium]
MEEDSKFNVGDHCVWKGQGLARIESLQNEGGQDVLHLVIVSSGMKVGMPAANADRAIRRVLDRETAAGVWAELKKPAEADTRTWEDRYFDYARTLVKCTAQDQVLHLRRMYGSAFKPTFGERKLIDAYEELLFSELGHVLGRTTEDLRTEMKALHPVFSPTAGERPPEPKLPESKPEGPSVAGFDLLGSFQVEGGLVVADPIYVSSEADQRSGVNYRVAALPGKWYGYAAEDEEMGRTGVLVAVHALKVEVKPSLFRKDPLTALRKKANVVSNVRVDGGQMAVLDQAVRNEERFEDELSFRTRYGTVLNRGCTSKSGFGDGTYPVSVVREGEQAVYVQVDFR